MLAATSILEYLICDILESMMEVVVKIKMTFGKHTLVEDREKRTVNYRPWGKHNQPHIRDGDSSKSSTPKIKESMNRPLIQDLHLTLGPGSTWDKVLTIHPQF